VPLTADSPIVDAAVALGLGLMIGLEREHRETAQAAQPAEKVEVFMGVRTFALLALAGWGAGFVGATLPWVAPAVVLAAAALMAVPLGLPGTAARGLTTEVAGLVTVVLGMLVTRDRELAVALGVTTAVLLVSKPWFRRLVPRLRLVDFTSTLELLVALAVVLPLLPTEATDPWGVLPPRRIGLFVTLILGVSWIGYVLARAVGERRGAGITGLVGGLASSTAVTATMAQRAAARPELAAPAQMATLLASAVMSVRVIVLCAVVAPPVARDVAVPLGVLGGVLLLGAAGRWRAARTPTDDPKRDDAGEDGVRLENPMSLVSALKWGAFMTLVLVAAAAGRRLFGDSGVLATAALSGLADVDAITLALTREVGEARLGLHTATLAIFIAAAVNSLVKCGMAVVTGGRAYGRYLAVVFGVGLAAGLMAALIT
jgi:uncharacterized membrane protein (DUF4010 family)